MPTIRHLAALAGVAPSTVSKALRDDPTIGATTRQRIQALAEEYHYSPNRVMHTLLTTGKTRSIGVVLPALTYPFCAALLCGIQQRAQHEGFNVLVLEERRATPGQLRVVIQTLLEYRVDGVILYSFSVSRAVMLALRSHQVATVGLDFSECPFPCPTIRTDEDQLADTAVRYLCALGHTKIAYCSVERKALREEAMHAAIAELTGRPMQHFTAHNVDTMGAEILAAYAAAPRPTALIAFNDDLAAAILQQAQAQGLRVPESVSVLGIGNHPLTQHLYPSLTTIDQHPMLLGETAVTTLLQELDAPTSPAQVITLPSELIIRASCAPPRGS
jgi:LacI family repressor for deo operon, udp, cdd, tsx, nupC, and nupG